MVPLATIPPKRRRGRVKGIIDDAFFDPLPDVEIKVWEEGRNFFSIRTRCVGGKKMIRSSKNVRLKPLLMKIILFL